MQQKNNQNIHIILCCDNNYIKYAATTIFSIVNTAKIHNDFVYDAGNVHYLEQVGLKNILCKSFKELENFSFINSPNKEIFKQKLLTKNLGGGGGKSLNNNISTQHKMNLNIKNNSIHTTVSNKMADNLKDSNLIFHIILDYISTYNSYKIQLLESMLGVKIKVDIINPDIFQDLIPWGEGKNYTTYYRLKIASFLPVNVSKCIYLDCDMICNADIRELFFTDLNGHICGVVGDVRTSYEPMWEIEDKNFSIRTKYSFNAGLLLIDMDKWRIQNIESKLFSLLKDVRLTDQDALNIVFNDDILLIDPRWNCFPVLLQFKPSTAWHHIFYDEATQNIKPTTSFTRYEYENICKEAKIIHFAGPKPWQKRAYDSPNTNMWNLKRWYFRLWWLNSACTPFYKDITYKTLELKKSIYDTIKLPEKSIRAFIKYIGNLLFKNF